VKGADSLLNGVEKDGYLADDHLLELVEQRTEALRGGAEIDGVSAWRTMTKTQVSSIVPRIQVFIRPPW
jgi:hypothetical protein